MLTLLKAYYLLYLQEKDEKKKQMLEEKIQLIIEDIKQSNYKDLSEEPEWIEICRLFSIKKEGK
ncbi:hypothetical protein [Vagococcus xieshaowenii]|uniref:Uncharacterized protein n=1 Tax=Vagococcus xieshaowenii TaxID=2562451 RepID=A0AAJ5EGY7_9ENTE|nr:hypothetical protein [Vagococcus xieshaowenii]QCA29711.1 hypothetical protein E4Z98_09700 [Vagococcus xieshaowenii]TFZ42926.1 hypothetical protein E4031_01445 [Vagococcus xieshaowenii]